MSMCCQGRYSTPIRHIFRSIVDMD